MKIIKKPTEIVNIGSLNYGDVCESISGNIFMVVNSKFYIKEDKSVFDVTVVDLETGLLDRMSGSGRVRPIKLVAKLE